MPEPAVFVPELADPHEFVPNLVRRRPAVVLIRKFVAPMKRHTGRVETPHFAVHGGQDFGGYRLAVRAGVRSRWISESTSSRAL